MALLRVAGHSLLLNGTHYRCAIGKGGFSSAKKEGDGCTPLGTFALRECWYRGDRLPKPNTDLPLRIIQEHDGWCDDPRSEKYNRHLLLPLPLGEGRGEGDAAREISLAARPSSGALRHLLTVGEGVSYERLYRSDHVYDLIIPLGYNDNPVVPGCGSAIFMHLAHADYRPTEGCVALALPDLLKVLQLCDSGTTIEITANS